MLLDSSQLGHRDEVELLVYKTDEEEAGERRHFCLRGKNGSLKSAFPEGFTYGR